MTDRDHNPVKGLLFEHIGQARDEISNMVSQQRFNEVISDILRGCHDRAVQIGDREESAGMLATGILHYTLTCALIPSQRNVEHHGIRIDIAVPGLKMLDADARKALILYIPGTMDKDTITQGLERLRTVQPERQNIWLVTSAELKLGYRTYTISSRPTLPRIISDIAHFVNVQGHGKLGILRI